MSDIARLPNPKTDGPDADPADLRSAQTVALVWTLVDSLPATARERFYREVAEKIRSTTAPRAGDVLGTIIRLLPRQKAWSVAELKQRVDDNGVEATAKEIYNAIGYLARKGRVRRIAYGRYLVDGMELATVDDFGGETTRHEDEYRVNRDTE
jgi:hypothetical protein